MPISTQTTLIVSISYSTIIQIGPLLNSINFLILLLIIIFDAIYFAFRSTSITSAIFEPIAHMLINHSVIFKVIYLLIHALIFIFVVTISVLLIDSHTLIYLLPINVTTVELFDFSMIRWLISVNLLFLFYLQFNFIIILLFSLVILYVLPYDLFLLLYLLGLKCFVALSLHDLFHSIF